MAASYGQIITIITASNQTAVTQLVASPSDQLTGLRRLISRGVIRSKALLTQTEPLKSSNTASLILCTRPNGGAQWSEFADLWVPNVEAFARIDLLAEFGCAANDVWILPPNHQLGVKADRLADADLLTLHGDYYQDIEELVVLL